LVVSGADGGHAPPRGRALPGRPLTLDRRGELSARLLRSGGVPPRVSALVWLHAARVPCVVGRPGRSRLDERHRGPPAGPVAGRGQWHVDGGTTRIENCVIVSRGRISNV